MPKSGLDTLHAALQALGVDPLLSRVAALVALLRADGSLVDWNPAFDQHRQALPEAANLFDLIPADRRPALVELIEPAPHGGVRQGRVALLRSAGAGATEYECLVFTLSNDRRLFVAEIAGEGGGTPEETALLRQELSDARQLIRKKEVELKAILAQTEEISHLDPLTYLFNRRQILRLLENEAHRAERYRTPLSVSMIDIDHFKTINDTLGHTQGDRVLVALAKMLRRVVREADSLGRYGGEEFLMLLPNTKLLQAGEQAERLCTLVRQADFPTRKKIHITISIGIAEYRPGEETWQEVLNRADQALYAAKLAGRDRWERSK